MISPHAARHVAAVAMRRASTPSAAGRRAFHAVVRRSGPAPASAARAGLVARRAATPAVLFSAAVAGGAAWFVATTATAHASGEVTVFELGDLDEMLDNADRFPRQAVYDKLAALHEKYPKNGDVAWRFARATFDLSNEKAKTDKKEAKALMEAAFATISRALDEDRSNHNTHRWCGTILNGMSAFQSTKESIASTYRVREHWEDAISVEPSDATAKHLLGRWSYEVASLSWVKRNIAKALFGTPPVSSYDEALRYFESAEADQPGFWKMNQAMIAQCMDRLGRKEEAAEWAAKAAALPTRSDDDREAQAIADKVLAKHGKK